MCVAVMEGKVIQRLPHLGIYPIYSHQRQKVLFMPKSTCWQEHDILFSWEVLAEHNRDRCSQLVIGLSTGFPMEKLAKDRRWWGLQLHRRNSNIKHPDPLPRATQVLKYQPSSINEGTHGSIFICNRRFHCWAPIGEEAIGLDAPV